MTIYSDKYFENPVGIIAAFDTATFKKAFEKIERLKQKYYLVGYIRYEAKDIFLHKNISSNFPILYFEVYEGYRKFVQTQCNEDIYMFPTPDLTYKDYASAIGKIKSEIKCGNTYEVNFTHNFKVMTNGESFEIFNKLLDFQDTKYKAYFSNKYEEILSFSPELFFKLEDNKIITKPMKGTVKRGQNSAQDLKNIKFLKNDIKNRAENIMIVDLLRNDLGKIAKIGTVDVPKLFEIEEHKTLYQMTSTVQAKLRENISLYEIFKAIFPCGSITGAPKISTMKIIDEIEKGSRGVYCGAIGMIYKDTAEFSVPIRILQKKYNENFYNYRVGGAIVWDSTSRDEWNETIVKTSFLTENQQDLTLIETMKVENLKPLYFQEHIKRMKKSAKLLGFKFNKKIQELKPKYDGIFKIELYKNEEYKVSYRPLNVSKTNKIAISDIIIDSENILAQHKTNSRPQFEKSFEQIKAGEIYDEIFFNEKGELTEGARSNILIELGGKLYTPPTSCGLLGGILREKMLKEKKCFEKILYKEDLEKAENIYAINSVRGVKKVDFN